MEKVKLDRVEASVRAVKICNIWILNFFTSRPQEVSLGKTLKILREYKAMNPNASIEKINQSHA